MVKDALMRRNHESSCVQRQRWAHDSSSWVSRLARVVDRLGDGELDLVEQLALRVYIYRSLIV